MMINVNEHIFYSGSQVDVLFTLPELMLVNGNFIKTRTMEDKIWPEGISFKNLVDASIHTQAWSNIPNKKLLSITE